MHLQNKNKKGMTNRYVYHLSYIDCAPNKDFTDFTAYISTIAIAMKLRDIDFLCKTAENPTFPYIATIQSRHALSSETCRPAESSQRCNDYHSVFCSLSQASMDHRRHRQSFRVTSSESHSESLSNILSGADPQSPRPGGFCFSRDAQRRGWHRR